VAVPASKETHAFQRYQTRRECKTHYNADYPVMMPSIGAAGLEMLQACLSTRGDKWQILRVQAMRKDGGFIVISYRGAERTYKADLIISPSRTGYLIFVHDATRFEYDRDYQMSHCQTIEQVCDAVGGYCGVKRSPENIAGSQTT
jgi:hypothetical protein